MPSFDIASKVDLQTLDNAINTVKKEITNRYDFKGSHVEIELNKKELVLNVEVESDMKLGQVLDVLVSKTMRQGLDANIYDLSKEPYQSGKVYKKEIQCRSRFHYDEYADADRCSGKSRH